MDRYLLCINNFKVKIDEIGNKHYNMLILVHCFTCQGSRGLYGQKGDKGDRGDDGACGSKGDYTRQVPQGTQ